MMKSFKSLFGGDVRQFSMMGALLALIVYFQIMTNGKVLTPTNMVNLINGNSYVLILAIGMVMVIVIGHIDLSVGSVAAVVGIVVALAMRDWGIPWWAGILLGLAVGAAIGAWNGWWVAYVGVPGFITTLAGMMLFRGVNQFIGHSNAIPVPDQFKTIGAGYLWEWGPATGLNNSTLLLGILAAFYVVWHEWKLRKKALRIGMQPASIAIASIRSGVLIVVIGYVTFLYGSGRVGTSFPVPGVLLAALVIFYHVLTQRTVIGRHIFAVGGNRIAASLSGVSTKRTYFFVMMNMSILSAVAGMVFIGRSTSSGPFDGTNWELDAIAAVFIGGAAVSGGIGTVTGSIIGGFVMATLNNGLQLMGVGSDRTQIIKGLVLLVAVAFDVYNKQQGRPSIIGLLLRARPISKDSVDGAAETPPNVDPRTAAVAGVGADPTTAAVHAQHPTPDAKDRR